MLIEVLLSGLFLRTAPTAEASQGFSAPARATSLNAPLFSQPLPTKSHEDFRSIPRRFQAVKPAGHRLQPKDLMIQIEKLREAVENSTEMLQANAIDLYVDWKSIPGVVDLTNLDWSRICDNLVQNSIRAMPNGGNVLVDTQAILVARRVSNDNKPSVRRESMLRVRFSDTGNGIDSVHFNRLFEPGFTTRPNDGGNGLGLSGILRLVSRAVGYIDVETISGESTSFSLYLPIRNN